MGLLLGLPVLACAILDQQPFGGDQSQYGTAAIQLYAKLLHEPAAWYQTMLSTMHFKAPGLPWSGQLVLPLTEAGIPVDVVLRLSVAAAVVSSLVLLAAAARRLGFGPAPLVAGLLALVAGAPMAQSLGSDYMTEAPQLTIVAWFLFIMAGAPRWDRGFLFVQLALASSVAVLLKASTPFYVLLPAAVAARHLFRGPPRGRPWGLACGRTWAGSVLLAGLAIAGTHWFALNHTAVLQHMRGSTSGAVAALWGREDTYLNTLLYWIQATAGLFPFLVVALALLAATLFGRLLFGDRNRRPPSSHPRVEVAIVCVAQMALVLLLAGTSDNREPRYLLPLLPYAAVLTAWCATRLPGRWTPALFAASALAWWLAGSLASLDRIGFPAALTGAPPAPGEVNRRFLEDLVQRTSAGASAAGSSTVIAVDAALFGDWLAPEPAGYTAWKLALRQGERRPQVAYHYAGDSFLGAGPDETWQRLTKLQPRFVLLADPDVHPAEKAKFNLSLQGDNARILKRRLTESGHFSPAEAVGPWPGLLLFEARPSTEAMP